MTTLQVRDFAKVKGGKRLSDGYLVQDEKSDHPYIRVTDMEFDKLNTINIKFLPEGAYEKIKKYTISDDDIYISIAGTIGLVGKLPRYLSGANLTENAAKITDLDKSLIDRDYLIYFLRSRQGQFQIHARVGGSSQPKLALNRIETIEIPKRLIEEQRRISMLISAYDDLIGNNEKRIKILEEMAQKLYEEWFVKFKFPGYEKVKMIDSGTEFGMIPEGWKVEVLSVVSNINKNNIYKISGDELINYVDISSVSTGKIDRIQKILFKDAPSRARRIVCHGDLIWSTVRPNRKSYCLIIRPEINTIVSTGFAVISPKDVPFSYIYLALTSDKFVSYLVNHAIGSAYPAVVGKDFEDSLILVPNKESLDKFHILANKLFEEINILQKINKTLSNVRDLLISQLIIGKRELNN